MKSHPLVVIALVGCTSTTGDATGDGGSPSGEASAGGEADSADSAGSVDGGEAEPVGVVLERGVGHEISTTEVWLDPRASAALTLDRNGHVRLWPALPPAQRTLEAVAPIRLPVLEPAALSLARAGESGFVIAMIDTAQSARVLAVEVDGDGVARVVERFTIAPDDPMLELHVLDGGDRLLGLGVDHRLRLYDGHGALVSELTEYGLSPWQLRIAGPPEALRLAMVLAGPTRLQRFAIEDDRLVEVGEPYPFVLDRGPNRNDVGLLPSGHVAAVFRRPKRRTTEWTLELHDLDSGEVRVLWGEVESKLRPRVHLVDDHRALLEDGDGSGFWVDLDAAVVVPTPFELPETVEALPPESKVELRKVPLAASLQGARRHTSVVAGVRVAPSQLGLIVDPLTSDHHFRIAHTPMAVRAMALDHDGGRLALAQTGRVTVEAVGGGAGGNGEAVQTVQTVTGCLDPERQVQQLAFTDPDHLLLVSAEQAVICAWRTGEVVSSVDIPETEHFALRVRAPGDGEVGLALPVSWDEPEDLRKLTFADNQFAESVETVPKRQFGLWPELDESETTLALDRTGGRYVLPKLQARQFNIKREDGKRTVSLGSDRLRIERFVPSPDGRRLAATHVPARTYEDYGYYGYYEPPSNLSVWSIEGDEAERLWTMPASRWLDLTWSGDGERLALDRFPGVRVVTPNADVIYERAHGELTVEERPDDPNASDDASG